IEALAGFRRFRRLQYVDVARGAADLFQIAQRLLLDGGQPALNIALGRLAFGKVVGLVRLDDVVLIGLPHGVPALADFRVDRARLGDVLGAGDLGGLAEAAVYAFRQQLVIHVAHRRAGAEPRGGVALAALGRDPQIRD